MRSTMKCPSCDGDLENGWVEVVYTSWLLLLLASGWHAHCWFRPSGEGERVIIVPSVARCRAENQGTLPRPRQSLH